MNKLKMLSALLTVAGALFAQDQPTGNLPANAENAPALTFREIEHDFGTISEHDGNARHIFYFKNTGTAPLTITQVTATCGCTQPEWTRTPVEPGKEGSIIIVYGTKGRIGPFNKYATVFTNEDNGYKRHRLTIKGDVVEKPSDPIIAYVDTIGGVGVEQTRLYYKIFDATGINRKAVYLKNYNAETVYFSWDNVPDGMTITCPDSLKAEWPGEMSMVIDGTKTSDRRGRITDSFVWTVKDREGKTLGSETISVTANYIDDFSGMSTLQRVNAPSLEINNAILNFGVVKKGVFGAKGAKREALFTNTGKSDMIIHSISSDDPRVQIAFKKNIIRPGEALPVNIIVKANEAIDTEIDIVCNDPKGPVRKMKVTAQKTANVAAAPTASSASTSTAE